MREAGEQGCDVILCDTSGRLHTNWQLMEELAKVEREIKKRNAHAPHEVLLVLDGSTGLNMLNQVRRLLVLSLCVLCAQQWQRRGALTMVSACAWVVWQRRRCARTAVRRRCSRRCVAN